MNKNQRAFLVGLAYGTAFMAVVILAYALLEVT